MEYEIEFSEDMVVQLRTTALEFACDHVGMGEPAGMVAECAEKFLAFLLTGKAKAKIANLPPTCGPAESNIKPLICK